MSKCIKDLIVTEDGSFVTPVLKQGTILIINNIFAGEKMCVQVKSCTEKVLTVESTTTGQMLSLEPSMFDDVMEVVCVMEAPSNDLDDTLSDSVQKAKEVGEKALETGKKALVGLLDTAAELLQKASEQLKTLPTEEEEEDTKEDK